MVGYLVSNLFKCIIMRLYKRFLKEGDMLCLYGDDFYLWGYSS